jgi:hypothetical protein
MPDVSLIVVAIIGFLGQIAATVGAAFLFKEIMLIDIALLISIGSGSVAR